MNDKETEVSHGNEMSRSLAQFLNLSDFSDLKAIDQRTGWVPRQHHIKYIIKYFKNFKNFWTQISRFPICYCNAQENSVLSTGFTALINMLCAL